MSAENREILSAEVFIDSFGQKVDTSDIDAKLASVDRALQAYRCDAGMEDYAIAVLCGIVTGGIDSFMIPHISITKDTITAVPAQLLDCFQRSVKKKPQAIPAAPRVVIKKGIIDTIPQVREMARSATTLGFIAALLCRLSDSGMLRYDVEKLHLLPTDISRSSGIWIAGTAVVAAMMKWLYDATDLPSLPGGALRTLDRIQKVMRARPEMAQIVSSVDQWQVRLTREMKASEKNKGKVLGIDAIFLSLLSAIAGTQAFKGSRLAAAVEMYSQAERKGITAIPLAEALTQQAMPVLLNEILVRTAYFITRLARELAAHEDVKDIEWENVMPFGNRTIDRMVAIASMTFSTADVADAAFHAALDSGGNITLFGASFISKVNVVGIGRAAVAVYRNITADQEEIALLEERRQLMQAKTRLMTQRLEAYRARLEERVCEYIAEDISAFLTGFSFMDRGLVTGDSDSVIRGNVVIQRVLGREPQFTTQQQFDDLMDSDIPLKL